MKELKTDAVPGAPPAQLGCRVAVDAPHDQVRLLAEDYFEGLLREDELLGRLDAALGGLGDFCPEADAMAGLGVRVLHRFAAGCTVEVASPCVDDGGLSASSGKAGAAFDILFGNGMAAHVRIVRKIAQDWRDAEDAGDAALLEGAHAFGFPGGWLAKGWVEGLTLRVDDRESAFILLEADSVGSPVGFITTLVGLRELRCAREGLSLGDGTGNGESGWRSRVIGLAVDMLAGAGEGGLAQRLARTLAIERSPAAGGDLGGEAVTR